jgi:hypothetical protein
MKIYKDTIFLWTADKTSINPERCVGIVTGVTISPGSLGWKEERYNVQWSDGEFMTFSQNQIRDKFRYGKHITIIPPSHKDYDNLLKEYKLGSIN